MYFDMRASKHISYHEDFDKTSVYWNRSSSTAGNVKMYLYKLCSISFYVKVSQYASLYNSERYIRFACSHGFNDHKLSWILCVASQLWHTFFFFYLHELAQLETVTSSSYVSKLQLHIPVL